MSLPRSAKLPAERLGASRLLAVALQTVDDPIPKILLGVIPTLPPITAPAVVAVPAVIPTVIAAVAPIVTAAVVSIPADVSVVAPILAVLAALFLPGAALGIAPIAAALFFAVAPFELAAPFVAGVALVVVLIVVVLAVPAAFAFAVLQELPEGGVLRAGEEFAEEAVFGGMREHRQSEGGHGDQRSAGQLHHANLPKKEPDEVIISGEATIEQTFDAFY